MLTNTHRATVVIGTGDAIDRGDWITHKFTGSTLFVLGVATRYSDHALVESADGYADVYRVNALADYRPATLDDVHGYALRKAHAFNVESEGYVL